MSDGPLAWDVGGPVDAPAILLIHPMGADRRFWDQCRTAWENHLRCFAIDLHGAGESPVADRPIRPEEHAADIESFRKDQGLDRMTVVGCAVGAIVAASFAGLHPDACAALVLSNPCFKIEPGARAALARRAEAVRNRGLQAVLPDTLDAAFDSPARNRQRDTFEQRFAMQDPEQYALQIEAMLDADVSRDLLKLDMPLLVVAGARDRLLPPHHARAIAEAVAGSEYVVLEDGAHFIPYQVVQRFAPIVERFLQKHGQSAGR